MSNTDCELIAELKAVLTSQQYSPAVVGNYCAYSRGFLNHLERRDIPILEVTEAQVAQYLRHATGLFWKRHGRPPGPHWHSIPRSGIYALLRLAQGQWPPAPKVTCAADALRYEICHEYETWLREERGLARASIAALMWEAQYFLAWRIGRCGVDSLTELSVSDIDRYMDLRTPGLRRKSLKDVAERLRSLLRYLNRTILDRGQIAAVLETARKDTTPVGLRDYAILQLLATYGLRSSEIRNLRIEDINWRTESIRIRHTKTRACSFLPLMEPVGDAVLAYLRSGRPRTDSREIFIRTRAPYRQLWILHSTVQRRLRDAGVKPPGKCGPHIFRHARAVEMLRASVPQKVIGDLLGHRSTESTAPYLKLATEDLRAIALDVPGSEVLS